MQLGSRFREKRKTDLLISFVNCIFASFETRGELEPKRVPQFFLGSFLGMRLSAIGQFCPLSLVTVPEGFANVYLASFLHVSKVANTQRILVPRAFWGSEDEDQEALGTQDLKS